MPNAHRWSIRWSPTSPRFSSISDARRRWRYVGRCWGGRPPPRVRLPGLADGARIDRWFLCDEDAERGAALILASWCGAGGDRRVALARAAALVHRVCNRRDQSKRSRSRCRRAWARQILNDTHAAGPRLSGRALGVSTAPTPSPTAPSGRSQYAQDCSSHNLPRHGLRALRSGYASPAFFLAKGVILRCPPTNRDWIDVESAPRAKGRKTSSTRTGRPCVAATRRSFGSGVHSLRGAREGVVGPCTVSPRSGLTTSTSIPGCRRSRGRDRGSSATVASSSPRGAPALLYDGGAARNGAATAAPEFTTFAMPALFPGDVRSRQGRPCAGARAAQALGRWGRAALANPE